MGANSSRRNTQYMYKNTQPIVQVPNLEVSNERYLLPPDQTDQVTKLPSEASTSLSASSPDATVLRTSASGSPSQLVVTGLRTPGQTDIVPTVYTREQLEQIRIYEMAQKIKNCDAIIDKLVKEFSELILFTNKHNSQKEFTNYYYHHNEETVITVMQKMQTIFVDAVFTSDISPMHVPRIIATW